MTEIDLRAKFPGLRPIRSTPKLWLFNGCGLTVYGKRNIDAETGTYVVTHCFCLLWIPLFALGAYRVAPGEAGGWYFLGKEPLSSLARTWNAVTTVSLLTTGAGLGWNAYTSTPGFQADREIARADRLAEEGDLVGAARAYRDVALGTTDRAAKAVARILDLLPLEAGRSPAHGAGKAGTLAEVVTIAGQVVDRPGRPDRKAVLVARATVLAAELAKTEPLAAVAVLEAAIPFASDPGPIESTGERILTSVVKKRPDDLEPVVRLAVIHERRGRAGECRALLEPRRARLGTGEGARILGQLDVREGRFDEALLLLEPYAEKRLPRLHDASRSFNAMMEEAWNTEVKRFEDREAPASLYRRLERTSNEQRQRVLIQEYIHQRIRQRPDLLEKREALRRLSSVVPVVLDIGVAHLSRAQGISDPARRRAELEAAEKTFLSIESAAGDTDEYKMALGQVYYWMGRNKEGKALFDGLLAKHQRSTGILLTVAGTLRNLGVQTEVRSLAEEAYRGESDPGRKSQAAHLRALVRKDTDDAIEWLERADTTNPLIRASLNDARANKAIAEGRVKEAENYLKKAVDDYARLPESATSLNNGGLAWISRFDVTGDPAAFERGLKLLEKAVELAPDDSILSFNVSQGVMRGALIDLIGSDIDLKVVKSYIDLPLLGYFYAEQKELDRLRERVREHPKVKRALQYCQRSRVLAPKNPNVYEFLAGFHQFMQDTESLARLVERADAAAPDPSDAIRAAREHYAKTSDPRMRKSVAAQVERGRKAMVAARAAGGRTLALAAGHLARQLIRQTHYGLAVDEDEVVSLAEEADRAAASEATRRLLADALMLRAARSIAAARPAFAKAVEASHRTLPPEYRIAAAVDLGEEVKAAIVANADVRRSLELWIVHRERLPREPSLLAWALLRRVHPDAAAVEARLLDAHRAFIDLIRRLQAAIAPLSGAPAMNTYWSLMRRERPAEARRFLEQAIEKGIPLPRLP